MARNYIEEALEEKLERDERRQAFLEYLHDLERADPTPERTKRRAVRRAEKIRRTAAT